MGSHFNHSTLVKHHDHFGLTNRRKPVGDEEDRLVVEIFQKVVADLPLCFVVQSAGGLIHHQQLGIAQQGARNGHPLTLTTTQRRTPFTDGVL
ncbi:MAG: hypothetical protein CM15mP116_00410 [Synechococcus sp.]|nr:MAG: hypothetical protein CM15mP116_00410 [Synechococcus sp.]